MFKGIKNSWNKARADVLRKEVEDIIQRLQTAEEAVNFRSATTLAEAYKNIESQFGLISNVSNNGKKQLAKKLLQDAKITFDFDMGKGIGLAILSAYLESMTLPGDDAKFVESVTFRMIDAALTVAEENTKIGLEIVNIDNESKDITHDQNPLDLVDKHLRVMGYDLTSYGAGVALLEVQSKVVITR